MISLVRPLATGCLALATLIACGGGSQSKVAGVDPATPDAGCTGQCANTATSLSVADIEFVIAQVASRLLLILLITSFVYAGTKFFLGTRMDGSHLLLFVVLLAGSMSMIAMGLMVAARVTSEELAGGLLNMVTWPMMMLSGVWFSLEAASDWVRQLAGFFPLTHMLGAARAVMLDGAGFAVVLPALGTLLVMTAVFLACGALMFRWHPK